MKTEYLKGLLLTALGVLVLSFDALLIRLINAESFSLLFWRGLLMSLVVSLWCRYRYPGQPLLYKDWTSIRSGLFYALSAICFVNAINNTSVANVLVIISVQPLFSALIARVFIGEIFERGIIPIVAVLDPFLPPLLSRFTKTLTPLMSHLKAF